MSDFTRLTDQQIVEFAADHFTEFGVDVPPPEFPMNIRIGIDRGDVAVLKNAQGFAIVARANRRHHFTGSLLSPNADLIFLYVAPEARGRGVAQILVEQVKSKYMENQAVELVCVGPARRRMFEACGFRVVEGEGEQHVMVCD